jgi:DNA-binding transcriptional ArsR family regulator
MKNETAADALAALANAHRLRAFRALVNAAPEGLAAGELAERVGLSPSALSFHLAQLQRAGLIASRRQERFIIYTVDVEATRALVSFLTDDCCGGRPELCLREGDDAADPLENTA